MEGGNKKKRCRCDFLSAMSLTMMRSLFKLATALATEVNMTVEEVLEAFGEW